MFVSMQDSDRVAWG